jgi:hypothetical protein
MKTKSSCVEAAKPFCRVFGCVNDATHVDHCCAIHINTSEKLAGSPTGAREQLYALHRVTCNHALALMEKKNQDYAVESDPYRNFRTFGRMGILVRISDKLARLRTFEERGTLSVETESVEDTVRDIINYAVLYLGYK